MDACTYESITGLKNYYGFKSLLKNSGATERYSCDDDTIVFNRIVTLSFAFGPINLNSNQVAVILNLNNQYVGVSTSVVYELIRSLDLNNNNIFLGPTGSVCGTVVRGYFDWSYSPSQQKTITVAIFDLY